ncbi:unnamed protein product [Cyprideis torosa]|uniref:RING-type E3 ubiquitin transferase n=1 Tax=Cyprideis torosa TaxID=163714 RepID=A0A7R8W9N1_9CRUS|nr:unnamed protein product [Cyprideis torosa]CAG0890023.1 unnamed protein product [Cyprideis torosa]
MCPQRRTTMPRNLANVGRSAMSLQSTHLGVTCNLCLKTNFSGLRYKCLKCYDYDLCEDCHISGDFGDSSHSVSHPVQAILTPADRAVLLGSDNVRDGLGRCSLSCPACQEIGFTEGGLVAHFNSQHPTCKDVMCPVCVLIMDSDPGTVADLADHLVTVHMTDGSLLTDERGTAVVFPTVGTSDIPGVRETTNFTFPGSDDEDSTAMLDRITSMLVNRSGAQENPIRLTRRQLVRVRSEDDSDSPTTAEGTRSTGPPFNSDLQATPVTVAGPSTGSPSSRYPRATPLRHPILQRNNNRGIRRISVPVTRLNLSAEARDRPLRPGLPSAPGHQFGPSPTSGGLFIAADKSSKLGPTLGPFLSGSLGKGGQQSSTEANRAAADKNAKRGGNEMLLLPQLEKRSLQKSKLALAAQQNRQEFVRDLLSSFQYLDPNFELPDPLQNVPVDAAEMNHEDDPSDDEGRSLTVSPDGSEEPELHFDDRASEGTVDQGSDSGSIVDLTANNRARDSMSTPDSLPALEGPSPDESLVCPRPAQESPNYPLFSRDYQTSHDEIEAYFSTLSAADVAAQRLFCGGQEVEWVGIDDWDNWDTDGV